MPGKLPKETLAIAQRILPNELGTETKLVGVKQPLSIAEVNGKRLV